MTVPIAYYQVEIVQLLPMTVMQIIEMLRFSLHRQVAILIRRLFQLLYHNDDDYVSEQVSTTGLSYLNHDHTKESN